MRQQHVMTDAHQLAAVLRNRSQLRGETDRVHCSRNSLVLIRRRQRSHRCAIAAWLPSLNEIAIVNPGSPQHRSPITAMLLSSAYRTARSSSCPVQSWCRASAHIPARRPAEAAVCSHAQHRVALPRQQARRPATSIDCAEFPAHGCSNAAPAAHSTSTVEESPRSADLHVHQHNRMVRVQMNSRSP